MPVMKCLDCDDLCMPDDQLSPATSCENCGSVRLECDHPGGTFDKKLQCFVCSWCQKQNYRDISKLRKLARERPELGLQKLVDVQTH